MLFLKVITGMGEKGITFAYRGAEV